MTSRSDTDLTRSDREDVFVEAVKTPAAEEAPFRIIAVSSHPIQYFAPLYRRLSREHDLHLTILYCSRIGLDTYHDREFGTDFHWDIPLLDGYSSHFLWNLRGPAQPPGMLTLINPGIIATLWRERPDAVWLHGHNSVTNLLALGVAVLCGIPVLMRSETHLGLQRSRIKTAVRRPLMGLLYRRLCSACLCIGSRNRRFYEYLGVPNSRLFDVPYTVDNEFFASRADNWRSRSVGFRGDLALPDDKPIVLFASKLISRKRPFDLLLAFEQVRARGVDAALAYVGAGEEEALLRRFVEERGIADVYFCGFRNQTELPKFYAAADLFVLPSEDEPWGLVVNEVLAAGLPVITTTAVGAADDLVLNGWNGYQIRPGDIEALVDSMSTILRDPDLREVMSRRSREHIAHWDYERCVRGIRAALWAVTGRQTANTQRGESSMDEPSFSRRDG